MYNLVGLHQDEPLADFDRQLFPAVLPLAEQLQHPVQIRPGSRLVAGRSATHPLRTRSTASARRSASTGLSR